MPRYYAERAARVIGKSREHLDLHLPVAAECHTCAGKTGCARGCARGSASGTVRLAIPLAGDLAVGTAAKLRLPASVLARAAMWAYLLPAVMVVAGAWIGLQLRGGDLASATGAVCGLALGCYWLSLYDARRGGQRSLALLSVIPAEKIPE